MKNILLFFLLLAAQWVSAQKHDNVWVLGYHGQNFHPLQNNMFVNFETIPPTIIGLNLLTGVSFGNCNASICDYDGQLLFSFNGITVADANGYIMDNGDTLNNFGITNWYYESGLPLFQGALILPQPENDSLFYLFYEPIYFESNGLGYHYPKLFYAKVNIKANNGLGSVIEKDSTIITDTLAYGKITACKHANGRDWWVLMQEEDQLNNGIYTLLLTPNGIINLGKQEFPIPELNVEPSVGEALFTPDGTKYIRSDIRFDPWNAITIYDFDRCTGALIPIEYFELNDTTFIYGGAAVSPDSRYLYAVTNKIIYQFDLWASDIESTKTIVAEYDGFVGFFFQTLFGTPQLAPDGSIWVASVSDTIMHVIRTPNQPGTASHVDQHAIHLPKINQKSIPNFPNFRLGPLDDSACDTLGLDNHPLADFTWFAEELAVTFSDNSFYRPEAWAWDFGDGGTSAERSPLHDYEAPGEYYVCLIVSNEYASDTICHWVQVALIIPVAAFTWDAVELDVTFSNNSYNSPDSFLWDFGDSGTSTAANPLHTYPAPGTYNTCLTATNANGSNTLCQQVVVDSLPDSASLVVQLAIQSNVSVHPNPTTGKVTIEMSKPLSTAIVWSLHDILGREVHREVILAGQREQVISLAGLADGLYFWQVSSEEKPQGGKQAGSGKLVIIRK